MQAGTTNLGVSSAAIRFVIPAIRSISSGVRGWRLGLIALVAPLALTIQPETAASQFTSPTAGAAVSVPRVFLDCQRRMCDRTHFRTELQFVDWVQDRQDSDVHVIMTDDGVAGGGRRYTLDFIGRGPMSDLTDRFTYTASGTDVDLETLRGITGVLRFGLMRFAVQSGMGRDFDVRYVGTPLPTSGVADGSPGAAPVMVRDPWNAWTFRVGLSGNMNLRETSTNIRLNPAVSADRVTEAWKLGLAGALNLQRNRRELSGGREVRDDRDDWEVEGLLVRSVTGHISVGMDFGGENSVANNRDARLAFAPAVEYNYFPYEQANRRQLLVLYSAGMEHSNYIEETIFNAYRETIPIHRLRVRYNAREEWGNAGLGVNYSQYLHDTSFYRAGLNGNVNYRILRGLDLSVSANASRVNDQIFVPLSGISDEDILLGRRSLPSSYQYNGSVGLSYRWGSTFTNVVNTRFAASAGF
jgi:hypothetical protein